MSILFIQRGLPSVFSTFVVKHGRSPRVTYVQAVCIVGILISFGLFVGWLIG